MNSKGKIDRSVFYVKVDDHFGIVEWLAIMSAIKFLKPADVTVFSAGVVQGCWWRRIRSFITHKLIPEHAWVTELNGKKVKELAHKSDFLRMELLYRQGGIYMDTDIIVLKPFDSLLNNQIVLAEEAKGVPNVAVMLARNRSCFMCDFMKLACHRFDGSWAAHSVFTLVQMYRSNWKHYNGAVLLQQREGFYAFHWSELHELYEVDMKDISLNVSQAYAIHLYNHISAGYLKKLSDFNWIAENQSPAARAFRTVLPDGFSRKHLDEDLCLDLP